uniref:Uncharacterized protein n=1 Tax=Rhodopseudomonas palustris (strain BisA53) TaxID=316055 RepID=Q07TC2_RHOP5
MSKMAKKTGAARRKTASAKRGGAKKLKAKKSIKKGKSGAETAAKVGAKPTAAVRRTVLQNLTSFATRHEKAPVCFQPLGDGSWLICYLRSNGTYECQPYNGPIHQPICG